MSFRIHSVPAQSAAPCIIRVKHHQLPKDRALAQLESELDYEDDYDEEEEKKIDPEPSTQHVAQHVAQSPLPPVINQQVDPVLAAPGPVDETFKLRRKRRV